jgi:putative AlgH/UPF0301 family transcriptional regulator
MRYLVKASDDGTFGEILTKLLKNTKVFIVSERRRYASTGDIPDSVREEILSRGGEIEEDTRFDLEQS